MSTIDSNIQQQPGLKLLRGGKEESSLRDSDPRRVHAREFIPHLALLTTVVSLAGAAAVGGAIKAGESLFSGSGRPVPSVRALEEFPRYVEVTPVTAKAAEAGASAMGGLIDPQVYTTSSTEPGTEASNLDTAISSRGPDVPGVSFRVPVLDPKTFTPGQIKSPDFIVGPEQ